MSPLSNTMSRAFFILPLLLFAVNLVAQTEQHVVHLTVPKPLKKLGFEIAEVLDRRIDKSNIGFASIEISKRRVPAVVPDSFETYLTNTLRELVVSEGEKITILIHEFYVTEHTKGTATLGSFRVQMEFAKSLEGKLYSLGFSEEIIEGIGEFVETRYSEFIMKGLKKCLNDFARSDWREEQGELIDDTIDFKYDHTQIPKRGLYSSFAKMARNEPFMETDFVIKGTDGQRWVKYHKYYVEHDRTRKIRKRIFGFSYGNKIYINASAYCRGLYFVRAKLIGRYLYFEDLHTNPSTAAFFATNATTRPIGIVIDTESGFLVVLNDHELNEILNKYPEVKETYSQSKKKIADKRAAIEAINALY